jgi:hypothetical protein
LEETRIESVFIKQGLAHMSHFLNNFVKKSPKNAEKTRNEKNRKKFNSVPFRNITKNF